MKCDMCLIDLQDHARSSWTRMGEEKHVPWLWIHGVSHCRPVRLSTGFGIFWWFWSLHLDGCEWTKASSQSLEVKVREGGERKLAWEEKDKRMHEGIRRTGRMWWWWQTYDVLWCILQILSICLLHPLYHRTKQMDKFPPLQVARFLLSSLPPPPVTIIITVVVAIFCGHYHQTQHIWRHTSQESWQRNGLKCDVIWL